MTLTEFAKLMADFEAEAKKVGAISNVGTVPEGVVFQLRLGGYHGKIAMSWRELEETADPSITVRRVMDAWDPYLKSKAAGQ
jgi:hypothetical protein